MARCLFIIAGVTGLVGAMAVDDVVEPLDTGRLGVDRHLVDPVLRIVSDHERALGASDPPGVPGMVGQVGTDVGRSRDRVIVRSLLTSSPSRDDAGEIRQLALDDVACQIGSRPPAQASCVPPGF